MAALHRFINGIKTVSLLVPNQPTYTCVPVNGDQVYVVMTSSLACVSGNPATSNTIAMVVNPLLPVSVSVTADQNNVCEGTTVTFTGIAINGGSTAVYQWYKNSVPVGSNQSTYTYVPANGDLVYVVMTSSLACVSGNPATSNTIAMVVNPLLPVSVSVSARPEQCLRRDICYIYSSRHKWRLCTGLSMVQKQRPCWFQSAHIFLCSCKWRPGLCCYDIEPDLCIW